jgi:hypothetical protein
MAEWNAGLPPIPKKDDGSRLISEWYTVRATFENSNEDFITKAYYHVFHGWMVKGEPEGEWKFGYKPIGKKVEGWK